MTKPVAAKGPKASRPVMKGYGVPKSLKGALPWKWAEERLRQSHNYLMITVRPTGAPHAMPVWGIWLDGGFYFSTSATSRKGRNLARNRRCVVCTEDAAEAVILEGVAEKLQSKDIPQQAFVDYKAKYKWGLDPKMGPVFAVRPKVVFAMPEKLFPKGVTRWRFE
ncbi:MAG TPA: pyridoxamine 5'-phosphate oxidase family protein [Bryocella sp.]|nr:pyridoxamine 5'-phosphate oxidase family protein [Bryocella sp.]